MAERSVTFLWSMRAIFVVLCGLAIFVQFLPLNPMPAGWTAPDLMVALTFAWILRRPEYTPLILIAAVFLLADFLFHRPPGLWAALVLIGSQALRARSQDLRDLTFAMEWLSVATTLILLSVGYRIILAVFLLDLPPLVPSLTQLLATVFAYPIVVLASQTLLRVRKTAPGEVDAMRSS